MSLTINGVTPKTIRVVKNGQTTELKALKVNKNGVDKYVWAKPYTLRLSCAANSTLTVTRISSQYAHAGIGTLYHLSEIYYGDEIRITASASGGYSASVYVNNSLQGSLNFTRTVEGDLSVSTQAISTVPSLSSPRLSGRFIYDSYANAYDLDVQIQNLNSVKVTAKIAVYYNHGRLDREYTMSINNNTEKTYYHGEMYSTGAYVKVTFECAGYQSSSAEITFGDYTQ